MRAAITYFNRRVCRRLTAGRLYGNNFKSRCDVRRRAFEVFPVDD